jgi:hypothetical protein
MDRSNDRNDEAYRHRDEPSRFVVTVRSHHSHAGTLPGRGAAPPELEVVGQRGWLVVLHMLHEQDHTWRCRKFITSFRELCAQLGIDPDEPVWQYWTQQSLADPKTPGRAENEGWMPYMFWW